MKTTNEQIFKNVSERGYITKQEIQLLKNRSNKEQKDLFNYDFMESFGDGYGIQVSEEQGEQGLKWLKRFIKNGVINGSREVEIINNSTNKDFRFRGFYDCGRFYKNYLPIYEVGGMEYIPMATPYIIG